MIIDWDSYARARCRDLSWFPNFAASLTKANSNSPPLRPPPVRLWSLLGFGGITVTKQFKSPPMCDECLLGPIQQRDMSDINSSTCR